MSFSQQFLDEIRDRNDIQDVISKYVPLKRAGSNMVGLCPFHSEKSPSFTVFTGSRSFYCFGCGAGGDVVSFVMRSEGLDYPGAIEFLADRAGIPMEDGQNRTRSAPAVKRERIIEVTTDAARFFRDALNSQAGEQARAYVARRGYTQATVKRFGIGYAPNDWRQLTEFLTSKGYTELEITTAFLASKSQKNGNLYDIFRNRLMFPIFDLQNNVVAFSGRRLNDADERKYINTSDTPAFKKSKLLFGLNIAKNNDGSLLLCEGAVDAIALHQAGFSNAVATLGTAITPEHARIIARYAKTVFLCYDMDDAGTHAKLKAINLLNEAGVKAEIVTLAEDTKDPDEFIKKYGAEAFRAKLGGSLGQIDFQIEQVLRKYDTSNPDEKLRAISELTAFISELPNETTREVYTGRIAEKLKLSRKPLVEEVERKASYANRKAVKAVSDSIIRTQSGYGDRVNPDKIKFSAEALLEEAVLGMMLLVPTLGQYGVTLVDENSFFTAFNKKVFLLFKDDFASGTEIMLSKDGVLTQDEVSVLSRYMAIRRELGTNTEPELAGIAEKLNGCKVKTDFDRAIEERGSEALTEYIKLKKKNT